MSEKLSRKRTVAGSADATADAAAAKPNAAKPNAKTATAAVPANNGDRTTAGNGGEAFVPLVGLGGSAGSIQVLEEFFGQMPPDSGMAFVVVLHLSPDHPSHLAEILQRTTTMPVTQVTATQKARPNHVYVIAPGQDLSMANGKIVTRPMERLHGRRVVIDQFFRSMAESHGSHAVGVVLSGTDGDGVSGLGRIKEANGVTLAQDPEEATYEGIPRSAIAAGQVDWVLPIAEMPRKLLQLRLHESRIKLPAPESTARESTDISAEGALREILAYLRVRTGHDFSHYKRGTILRRIGRRLQVNELDDLPSYLSFLRSHPSEASALLEDLLISVTNFFRDPEAFKALDSRLDALFRDKKSTDQIRVWVAGCATGEEAYGLAILLCEHAQEKTGPPTIQIFASDISLDAIATARAGIYSASIAADISPERLKRFFNLEGSNYRVKKELRELVLFVSHNVLKDPPFSRLDLVACRNLMIYFGREAQRHVFGLFHFALKDDGMLFLGGSEGADEDNQLFATADKKHRIFTRRNLPRTVSPVMPLAARSIPQLPPIVLPLALPEIPFDLALPPENFPSSARVPRMESLGELHLRLIEQQAPPSVLVNLDYDILHISRSASEYLHFKGGEVSLNILDAIAPELRVELRAALFRATQENIAVSAGAVPVQRGKASHLVDVGVNPMSMAPTAENSQGQRLLLVTIAPHSSDDQLAGSPTTLGLEQPAVQHLEAELHHLRESMRSTTERYESSVEELKASNEELQAINEELRSATEELESGTEELQSVNEELVTVNLELKFNVEEVTRSHNDLQNLMAATDIATVFLDRQLRIQRYTPAALELFHLIPGDIGRPLSDLRHDFAGVDLKRDALNVLDRLTRVEYEARAASGQWYLTRLSPYRTSEDRIDGVVLTFVDITVRKKAEDELLEAHHDLERRVKERTKALEDEAARRVRLENERTKLMKRVVSVQEDERRRISRELHDQLGQSLTALLLNLDALAPKNGSTIDIQALPGQVQRLKEMTGDLIRHTHHIAWELRPSALDNVGLEAALQQSIQEWQAKGLDIDFAARVDKSGGGLSPDSETALYRVVQEALSNVLNHAQASRVSVILEQGDDHFITAIVEDDGIGFVPAEPANSQQLGVMGMHERMVQVGGSLKIESSPTAGTTVYARAPSQPAKR